MFRTNKLRSAVKSGIQVVLISGENYPDGWRDVGLDEFKSYLAARGTLLDKFDRDLFRRLI